MMMKDLERLSLIMTLHDIGFTTEEVETYMRLMLEQTDSERERLRMLNRKRIPRWTNSISGSASSRDWTISGMRSRKHRLERSDRYGCHSVEQPCSDAPVGVGCFSGDGSDCLQRERSDGSENGYRLIDTAAATATSGLWEKRSKTVGFPERKYS